MAGAKEGEKWAVTVCTIQALWSIPSGKLLHFLLFKLQTGQTGNTHEYILYGNVCFKIPCISEIKKQKGWELTCYTQKGKLEHLWLTNWQPNLSLGIVASVARFSWDFIFQHSGWESVETYKLHLAVLADRLSASVTDPADCDAEFVARHCRECENSITVRDEMILEFDCSRQGSWWETVVVRPGEMWEEQPVHAAYLKTTY